MVENSGRVHYPVLLSGDTVFLGVSEIKMLEYDANRKKQLWQSMQRMFLA